MENIHVVLKRTVFIAQIFFLFLSLQYELIALFTVRTKNEPSTVKMTLEGTAQQLYNH